MRDGTKVYFVTGDKNVISAYDAHTFDYTLYVLTKNDDHPGTPLFHWQKVSSATSSQRHLSVDDAFSELTLSLFGLEK